VFQEFSDEWLDGVVETAPIDVSKISTVPMSFFIGWLDVVCPALTAWEYIDDITAGVR